MGLRPSDPNEIDGLRMLSGKAYTGASDRLADNWLTALV